MTTPACPGRKHARDAGADTALAMLAACDARIKRLAEFFSRTHMVRLVGGTGTVSALTQYGPTSATRALAGSIPHFPWA